MRIILFQKEKGSSIICLTNFPFMSLVAVVVNVGEIMANGGGGGGREASHKVLY